MQAVWGGSQHCCRQAFCPALGRKVVPRKVACQADRTDERLAPLIKVTHPLQSTEEERQRQPGPHEILNIAERDLSGFCSALPDDEETEECWAAYKYLQERRSMAEEECEVEYADSDGLSRPQCERLERFEQFVRDSVGAGNIVHFIHTLQALSRGDKRRLAEDLRAADSKSHDGQNVTEAAQELQKTLDRDTAATNAEQEAQERRNRVENLFYAMDKDNNGKLDVGEFREAMRELGDEMTGTSVATILDAMDVHGFISLDQFMAIVEAEAIESHSADARMLRRLSKDPIWWTRSNA